MRARLSIVCPSQLFDLNLSYNKFARTGLLHLAKCLTSNTGLISLDLLGHRINSEVASAFVEMFASNMTLCKLIWKLEVGGYNLRFTELTNRNTEIDRCVRDATDFIQLLPEVYAALLPFPPRRRCSFFFSLLRR